MKRHLLGWRLLLALLPVVVLAAALLAPASAFAGSGDSNTCNAEVKATQDPRVAAIDVDCGDEEIDVVRIDPSDQGSIEANDGTTCEEVGNDVYECRPEGGGSSISVRFNDEVGDVCADPRLTVDFEVEFADEGGSDGGGESLDNVEVSGCSDDNDGGSGSDAGSSAECDAEQTTTGDSGDRETGDFESRDTRETQESDDDCPPSGGVDSGAGGTAAPRAPSAPAVIIVPSLLGGGLLVTGLLAARRRSSP